MPYSHERKQAIAHRSQRSVTYVEIPRIAPIASQNRHARSLGAANPVKLMGSDIEDGQWKT